MERAMHNIGGADRPRLDGIDVRSLVGDENNLAAFRLAVDPLLDFEQMGAVSQVNVEQRTRLRLRTVNVVDINKRQVKNSAQLPADSPLFRRCVGKYAKLIHHG